MHNLLQDPVIELRLPEGSKKRASLPEVLERLGRKEGIVFTLIRDYQEAPWMAFLVHLGASCLVRAGVSDPAQTAEWYREALLRLSNGSEEAFTLIVKDLSKPAFGQTPVTDPFFGGDGWQELFTPNEDDGLVTAQEHTVKNSIVYPDPDHWIYALVSLNEQGGALSVQYARPSRTPPNGRVFVSFFPDFNLGEQFYREVLVAVELHPSLVSDPFKEGLVLAWLRPWVRREFHAQVCPKCGSESKLVGYLKKKEVGVKATFKCCGGEAKVPATEPLFRSELDPFYCDVARYLRLTVREDRIVGLRHATFDPRIDNRKTAVRDLWSPMVLGKGETEPEPTKLGPEGFTFRVISQILNEGFLPASLNRLSGEGPDIPMLFRGIARNQSATEGFHSRILNVPRPVAISLSGDRQKVANHAKELVRVATDAWGTLTEGVNECGNLLYESGFSDVTAKSLKSRTSLRLREVLDEAYPTFLFDFNEKCVQNWTDLAFASVYNILTTEIRVPSDRQLPWGQIAMDTYKRGLADAYRRIGLEVEEVVDNEINEDITNIARYMVTRLRYVESKDRARIRDANVNAPCEPFFFDIEAKVGEGEDFEKVRPLLLMGTWMARPNFVESHRPGWNLGGALKKAGVSQKKVRQMLEACPEDLQDRTHLLSPLRMIVQKGKKFDWSWVAALLLLDEGEEADRLRRAVFRDFYQAAAE